MQRERWRHTGFESSLRQPPTVHSGPVVSLLKAHSPHLENGATNAYTLYVCCKKIIALGPWLGWFTISQNTVGEALEFQPRRNSGQLCDRGQSPQTL